MRKIQFVFSVIVCLCGCARGQSQEQNAKVLAFADRIDSIGAASSVFRKQIEAILTNPGSDSAKAWYLLDSLGHLRDSVLERAQIVYRETLAELSKDTASRTFRFLAENVRLTMYNVDLQKRQDSVIHLSFIQGPRPSIESDAWQASAETVDSCMSYLNLEMGWTLQAMYDVFDSLGMYSMPIYSVRKKNRDLLVWGYATEMNSRTAALQRMESPIFALKDQVKSKQEWMHLDSLSAVAEAFYADMEFPRRRLLAELSRDTTDIAYKCGLRFWTVVKQQHIILRQMNSLIHSYFLFAKEEKFNKKPQKALASQIDSLNSKWESLFAEIQSTDAAFQAAREEYIAHKTW